MDGGLTYPYLLATTANDGSQGVFVPNIDTMAARVKVAGARNIFFDYSDVDVTIARRATIHCD